MSIEIAPGMEVVCISDFYDRITPVPKCTPHLPRNGVQYVVRAVVLQEVAGLTAACYRLQGLNNPHCKCVNTEMSFPHWFFRPITKKRDTTKAVKEIITKATGKVPENV